jgi:hypothetical protein
MQFILGLLTGVAVHETGHKLTARYYGENIEWQNNGWLCRAPCTNIKEIAIAGNLATAIVGEALLKLPKEYCETSFIDGLQTFNTLEPIRYSLLPDNYGDYKYVSEDKENLIALHAVSIGWRQFNERARKWMIVPTRNGLIIMKSF